MALRYIKEPLIGGHNMAEAESVIQEKMMKAFRHRGAYVYKNAQNEYTEKGRPDLSACVPVTAGRLVELFDADTTIGVFVSVEVKRPGHLNEVSEAQKIVGSKIQSAGGFWFLLDNVQDVNAFLDKLMGAKDGV